MLLHITNYTSIALLKNVNFIQGFCPLKIKITQFPDGFRLNMPRSYPAISGTPYCGHQRDRSVQVSAFQTCFVFLRSSLFQGIFWESHF